MNATTARRDAAAGANLVVGDSNRRREFLPAVHPAGPGRRRSHQSRPLPTGAAVINPFPAAGANGQTVAVLEGARYLRAPSIPGELQFPENGPIAAFDGDTSTAWVADRLVAPSQRWIEVGFNAPRDVPYVDVDPLSDAHGVVTEVDVNGVPPRGRPRLHADPGQPAPRQPAAGHDRPRRPAEGRARRSRRLSGDPDPGLPRAPAAAPAGADRPRPGRNRSAPRQPLVRVRADHRRRPVPPQPVRNRHGAQRPSGSRRRRGPDRAARVRAGCPLVLACRRGCTRRSTAADSTLDRMAGYTRARPVRLLLAFPGPARLPRVERVLGPARAPGWIGLWAPAEAPDPWISWTTPRPLRVVERAADAVQPARPPADAGADQLARRIERAARGRRRRNRRPCPARSPRAASA